MHNCLPRQSLLGKTQKYGISRGRGLLLQHFPVRSRMTYQNEQHGLHCSPAAAAAATEVGVFPASSEDYASIARLRADAFYEDERSRFVESFKKKFVAQEVDSLKERTMAGASGQLCECLLARAEDGQQVIGCIDIRVPRALTGKHPAGVPAEDEKGAYILNVVVDEENRGQGIGKALMREAMSRAVNVWQAENLYTHVEADNEVALHLYLTCGFQEHSSNSKFDSSVSLGKLILLKASADVVRRREDQSVSGSE